MTDEHKTEGLDSEEQAIEQAMNQAMATGSEPRLVRGGESADSGLVREYTEILGLLPYDLAPEAPAVHLKDQIMHRIRFGSGSAETADERSAASSQPVTAFPQVSPTMGTPAARRPLGSFAMAAMFAACLLGLGFFGGLTWQQSQEITQLKGQLAQAALLPQQSEASNLQQSEASNLQQSGASNLQQSEMVQAQQDLQTLRDRLKMITVIARQAYPMQRVSHGANRQTSADGIVYVCGQHQRWYLNLRGLEPTGPDEVYRLWFMTEAGQVDGGVLELGPDQSIEKDALSMPPGTKGFSVTRERIDPQAEPESLTILLGENAINL